MDSVIYNLHECESSVCVQATMTEPLPYIEDVQKLTDAKELSQAYMGLKDTNRCSASLYISSSIRSHVLNHKSITYCIYVV